MYRLTVQMGGKKNTSSYNYTIHSSIQSLSFTLGKRRWQQLAGSRQRHCHNQFQRVVHCVQLLVVQLDRQFRQHCSRNLGWHSACQVLRQLWHL